LIVWTEPRVNKSERKTSSLWAFRELETDVLGDDASKNGSNTGNSEEPWAKEQFATHGFWHGILPRRPRWV